MKSWLYSRIVGNKFVASEIPSQVSQLAPQYYSKAVLNHPYLWGYYSNTDLQTDVKKNDIAVAIS